MLEYSLAGGQDWKFAAKDVVDVPFTSNQRRLGCTRLLGWLDLQKAAAEICVSVSQWLNLVGLLVLGMNPSAGKPMFQHGPVASGSWRYKVEDHIFLQTPSAAACGILSASQGWLQTTDTNNTNTCLSYGWGSVPKATPKKYILAETTR